MEKQKSINWEWNKVSTPLSKMSYGQLTIVKNLLNDTKRPIWYGSHKKDILNEIKSIEAGRDKYATKQAIELIMQNRINRIRTSVDNVISKHQLFNNILKVGI